MAQQCLDRDITITPANGKISIRFAGKTIAETDAALNLAEGSYPVRLYVPRADVVADVLQPSQTNTTCPFKGVASYHHLSDGGETAGDAVWYYRDPCPQVGEIKDHVAFWGDRIEIVHS